MPPLSSLFTLDTYPLVTTIEDMAIAASIVMMILAGHFLLWKYRKVQSRPLYERILIDVIWWGLFASLIAATVGLFMLPNGGPGFTGFGIVVFNGLLVIGLVGIDLLANLVTIRIVRLVLVAVFTYYAAATAILDLQTVWDALHP